MSNGGGGGWDKNRRLSTRSTIPILFRSAAAYVPAISAACLPAVFLMNELNSRKECVTLRDTIRVVGSSTLQTG